MEENQMQIALNIFEILYTKGPQPISTISDQFFNGKTNFYMLSNNFHGDIHQFLQRYPSLFDIKNNMVYPVSHENNCKSEPLTNKKNLFKINPRRFSIDQHDVLPESEAILYFITYFRNNSQKWAHINDIRQHMLSATDNIQKLINSSSLSQFLYRNHEIFEMEGELIRLKDNIQSHIQNDYDGNKDKVNCRKKLKSKNPVNDINYNAIFILRDLIDSIYKTTARCSIPQLRSQIICQHGWKLASFIGYTNIELEEFLRKNSTFFTVNNDDLIENKDISNLSIIVLNNEDNQEASISQSLNSSKGTVYHISKLWGIIDLGHHEHVFFDKSILKNIEDLTKYFNVGEEVYFNALLASKESRAKWKATRVWKEADSKLYEQNLIKSPKKMSQQQSDNDSVPSSNYMMKIDEFLFNHNINDNDNDNEEINNDDVNDLLLSSFDDDDDDDLKLHDDIDDENTMRSIVSIGQQESCYFSNSLDNNSHSNNKNKISNNKKANNTHQPNTKTFKSIETQTLATGDIMAIQFYQE